MELKFIEGDMVSLVSGGPFMTIRGIHFDVLADRYDENRYDCIWFEYTNEGKREVHYCPFYAYELKKATDT
jgi:uncharacterized protein YodC (DUF2158 family)